ncbi:MAG TPA: hypothetical protein VGG29_18550 [Caulobacteraceae bacterium]
MHRLLGALLALTALAACEEVPFGPAPSPPPRVYAPPPPPSAPPDSFRESDFAWSTAAGASRVSGVLAYHGAGRYSCQSVLLAPETPWSRARMQVLYLSDTAADVPADEARARTPPEHGAQYARFVRQAPCDAAGHFTFAGLPSGPWFLITVATPASGGTKIAIMRRVETHGEAVRVALR